MNAIEKRYDALFIDVVNLAYKVFKHKTEEPVQISKKFVYKNSICDFINSVESLKNKYLHSDGDIYLLFDNYYSRADLRSAFMFADRKQLSEAYKANRKKDNKEFYNSLNFIRWYYLICNEKYHTVRIDNLEADDLVEPLLSIQKGNVLLISSDLDWTRYLSDRTNWLPSLKDEPKTIDEVSNDLGFKISKDRIIIYKAIFGDASDNISSIAVENKNNLQEFIDLLPKISYPEEVILLSRDRDLCEQYKILKAISNDEKAYTINMQLVSPIPCSPEHVKASLTCGRNAETMYKVVREALGLDESGDSFVFGNIHRPRV